MTGTIFPRASMAESFMDPEIGILHTNDVESANARLPLFRYDFICSVIMPFLFFKRNAPSRLVKRCRNIPLNCHIDPKIMRLAARRMNCGPTWRYATAHWEIGL